MARYTHCMPSHLSFKKDSMIENSYKRIGLMDSGIGGLSVLIPLVHSLSADFVYLADTKHVPYGDRSSEELIALATANVRFLLEHDVELIIIACNTLSTVALPTLKKRFPGIPLIGMVELIAHRAAQQTRTNTIGLMATTRTIESAVYQDYFARWYPHITLVPVACPALVPLIEQHPQPTLRIRAALKEYTQQLTASNIDTLMLGCTHYSFIENEIAKQLPNVKAVVSAQQVFDEMTESIIPDQTRPASVAFFITGDMQAFVDKISIMHQLPVPRTMQSAHIHISL
ncbi:MAG: glutamate racemase [Candidatus Babeliales bacterium]